MKKIITAMISMLFLLMLCAGAAAADSDFKHMPDYFAVGKYTSNGAAEIVIPANLNGEATPVLYADSLGMNGLKGVSALTISDGITHIGDQNVTSGKELSQVSLPDTLEVLGRRNFYQMDVIEEVTLPGNVAYVGSDCFSYCKSLKKVTFKGVCPTFGSSVFKNAPKDLVVYVPAGEIDAYAAALPEGLNIQSSGSKAAVSTVKLDESDFTFDRESGAVTGYTGRVGCFEIPAAIGGVPVKAVGKSAFFKNPFAAVVTIPEGVEVIEQSAFAASPMLYRVNFPSTLRQIGKGAFNGAKLDRLILPEGLEIIGESAFHTAFGLHKLGEIVVPGTVTQIGPKAFHSHKAERVVIGENVQTVGSEAFAFSNNMTEIVILGKNKVEFAGDTFAKTTTEATITLAEGLSQEVYQSYVDLMAIIYPTCTVNEPENMDLGFPVLDVMAGMPFFGTWQAVAGMDVMGDFTDNYPAVTATLNPDGTAAVQVDGMDKPSAWYVAEGYAILAPVADGKADAAGVYAFAGMDENGRLVMDLGYASAICEQEGKLYTAPAVPEKPWPEFDADNAKYFIGVWQTEDGSMRLTLNDDGTAAAAQEGEEPCVLQWYADYGTAYVGPAMSELARMTFDGSGGLKMKQGEEEIVLVPYAEPTPEPIANPTEGGEHLIGEWLDDIGNKLVLGADGTLTLTYAFDGWTDEDTWAVADGAAAVTAGRWEGCPITLENGILTITDGEGIFQIFSADGDLSAYYGEAEEALPEAMPIGAEGEPYFGTWTMDMGGMAMNLTLNQDGTCAMEVMGEAEPGVWNVTDGKANIMGDELYIDAQGQLVMESQGMVFVRLEGGAADEAMSDEDMAALLELLAAMEESESGIPEHLQGYVGEWHMVYMNFGGMSGHPGKVLGLNSKFTVNADGTAAVGFPIDKSGAWYEEDGNVYFGEEGMPLTLLSDGCLQYGSQLGGYFVFSKDADAAWEPTAGQAMTLAPGISNIPGATAGGQAAGFEKMEDRLEKKFVARSYTSFGQTMDASMLGAEYAVVFHENGLADFTLAGMCVSSLPWGLQKVAVGLSSVDAFCINYYGSMFNAVLTDSGFDMDYYGTMTLHFVLAE